MVTGSKGWMFVKNGSFLIINPLIRFSHVLGTVKEFAYIEICNIGLCQTTDDDMHKGCFHNHYDGTMRWH